MAIYQIDQFDGVLLPLYNPEQDLSPAAVDSTLEASIDATFDAAGSRREREHFQSQGHEESPQVSGILPVPPCRRNT